MILTQEIIKELFNYEDGLLYWKNSRANGKCKKGDLAGAICGNGYWYLTIDSKRYKRSRVIWLMFYGYTPEFFIDHINRDRLDDRIENLREVSHSCNMKNTGNSTLNKSGIKGIHWNSQCQKWNAQISIGGKSTHIGLYDSLLDAAEARYKKEKELNWLECDSTSPAYLYLKEHNAL